MKDQFKKHQNARSFDEKLKTKGMISFDPFFSYELQDFKF